MRFHWAVQYGDILSETKEIMCRHDCCSASPHAAALWASWYLVDRAQNKTASLDDRKRHLSLNPTAANLTPGSDALAPRSDVKRNVIPKNLERFTEGGLPKQPEVERLSEAVICILGKNPSAFTLNGTNIFLIGTGRRRVLLDTGEASPKAEQVIQALEEVFKQENVEGLDEIIITHLHHDHCGGAKAIAERFGPCRISKYPSPQTEIDRRREVIRLAREKAGLPEDSIEIPPEAAVTWIGLDFELNSGYHHLSEGELIRTKGADLRVFWTPGHASDHIVVLLEQEHALFCGDHILGWGTSWVDDLALYMQSLHKIRLLNPSRLYPGHGPCVQNAMQHIQRYIDHRSARERQILETLRKVAPFSGASSKEGVTSKDLTKALYPDTPKALIDRAEGNILKILVKLRKDGSVVSFDPDVRILTSLDDMATEFAERQKGNDGRSDPKVAVEEYDKIWYARQSGWGSSM